MKFTESHRLRRTETQEAGLEEPELSVGALKALLFCLASHTAQVFLASLGLLSLFSCSYFLLSCWVAIPSSPLLPGGLDTYEKPGYHPCFPFLPTSAVNLQPPSGPTCKSAADTHLPFYHQYLTQATLLFHRTSTPIQYPV